MPAKRKYATKAVHLNLPLELHAVLMDLCEATGQKPARFVHELLEQSAPQLVRLTKAARLAKTAPQAALGPLAEMLKDAMSQAGQVQEDFRQLERSVAVEGMAA